MEEINLFGVSDSSLSSNLVSCYFLDVKNDLFSVAPFQPVVHTIIFAVLVFILDQRDIGASGKCSCTHR